MRPIADQHDVRSGFGQFDDLLVTQGVPLQPTVKQARMRMVATTWSRNYSYLGKWVQRRTLN